MEEYIEIPAEQLASEVLVALIEDFITREGTDYGHRDYSLEEKVAQVHTQLKQHQITIVYDPASESCTLIRKE